MIFLEHKEEKLDDDVQSELAPRKTLSFYVVDAHTHIGKEEVFEYGRKAYRENSPKLTLDFYQKLQFEIINAMKIHPDEYCFSPTKPFTKPPTLLQMLLENIPTAQSLGWTADQFVAFPFNDSSAYKTSPSFQIPNDRVLSRATVLPYSLRMLGFVRVDPHDGEKAVQEIIRCSQQRARGLKLHPISQKFLNEMHSDNLKKVVATAARLGLPVLFDCRYKSTVEDIFHLAQEVRNEIGSSDFALIIGHSGMEYAKDEIYEFFKDPNIYAETSGVRGNDVSLYFKKMKSHVPNWSSKIVFGTDYNYFSTPQATDFLTYLFSKEFRDQIGGTPQDIQRILAGNLLSIIKPFIPTPPENGETPKGGKLYQVASEHIETFLRKLSQRAAQLIQEKKFTYITYDVLLSPEFDLNPENFIINLSHDKSKASQVIVASKGRNETGECLNVCNITEKLFHIKEDYIEEASQKTIINNKLYTKLIYESMFSGNQEKIKTEEEAEKLPKSLI